MNIIKATLVSESREGLRRWKISKEDAAILLPHIDTAKIRGFRSHLKGSFSFQTGGGYAIFDADLLGGNGSGQAENRLRDLGIIVERA